MAYNDYEGFSVMKPMAPGWAGRRKCRRSRHQFRLVTRRRPNSARIVRGSLRRRRRRNRQASDPSLRRGLRGLARLVARTQDRLRHFHRAGRRRSHVPPRKSRRDGQASVRHNRRGSDGSRERRLGRGDDLSWSPSGTHIAVSRDFRKPSLTAPETAIWVLNVDEGGDARSGRDKASASAAPRAAT
jgi:hypothetical protein